MGKKDYILRSKAIKAVTGWETDPTDEELKIALLNVPSADVVEVCRCKDCRHRGTMFCGMRKSPNEVKDYSFCSEGERKDGTR